MKTICLALLLLLGLTAPLWAQTDTPIDPKSIDHVGFLDSKARVYLGKDTNGLTLKTNVLFIEYIDISTNATYRVDQGKERTFSEGQVITKDGWLINPNGTVMPVRDHVAMQTGKLYLYKDGSGGPVTDDYKLGNGQTITPDGWTVSSTGARRRLLDGQMFLLDGTPLPAKDTILLKNGTVYVQKDGSQLTIPPSRFIGMNEGTKVFGEGYIIRSNGTRQQLVEGELILVDGVIVRNP